MHFMLQIL